MSVTTTFTYTLRLKGRYDVALVSEAAAEVRAAVDEVRDDTVVETLLDGIASRPEVYVHRGSHGGGMLVWADSFKALDLDPDSTFFTWLRRLQAGLGERGQLFTYARDAMLISYADQDAGPRFHRVSERGVREYRLDPTFSWGSQDDS